MVRGPSGEPSGLFIDLDRVVSGKHRGCGQEKSNTRDLPAKPVHIAPSATNFAETVPAYTLPMNRSQRREIVERGEQTANYGTLPRMALRSCLVSCRDLAGTEHAVEVTAESLYEAVAQALGVMRGDQWSRRSARG
jgi:hypothetical protein